jgi:hypothetical protein
VITVRIVLIIRLPDSWSDSFIAQTAARPATGFGPCRNRCAFAANRVKLSKPVDDILLISDGRRGIPCPPGMRFALFITRRQIVISDLSL